MAAFGARTLAQHYLTSPDIFAAERKRIFARRWVCAAHQSEFAQSGEFVLRQVAGESLIVVRGDDGAVRAFYNVCRHRGSRLCEIAKGRFPSAIRCAYHNWTYSLDGRLRGAPHRSDVPNFDADAMALRHVAVAIWEGLVFVSLAPLEPFEATSGPPLAKSGPGNLLVPHGPRTIEYDVAANWKLLFENFSERDDHAEDRRTSRYSIFPNLFLGLHPDYAMVHTLWPEGPARTHVRCDWLFQPDASGRDDAMSFWDTTKLQDWRVCERKQQDIASRAQETGPPSPRESIAGAFEREYLRAMDG